MWALLLISEESLPLSLQGVVQIVHILGAILCTEFQAYVNQVGSIVTICMIGPMGTVSQFCAAQVRENVIPYFVLI